MEKIIHFFKKRGYYIALTVCLAVIAVAGYIFVSTALRQQDEVDDPALSVPITAADPEDEPQNTDPQPSVKDQTHTPVLGPGESDADEQVKETVREIVVRPVSGQVMQDHAMDKLVYNPTTKDWRVHNGMDLAATPGQTVLAAKAGTVTAVYEDEKLGNTVVIRHDGGWTTHYANLTEASYVKAGDTVAAGDVIGTVGVSAKTELAQDSHLHFEVYLNGEPADPEEFLP